MEEKHIQRFLNAVLFKNEPDTNPNSFKDLLSTKVYKTGIESQQQILKEKVQNATWSEHRQQDYDLGLQAKYIQLSI